MFLTGWFHRLSHLNLLKDSQVDRGHEALSPKPSSFRCFFILELP